MLTRCLSVIAAALLAASALHVLPADARSGKAKRQSAQASVTDGGVNASRAAAITNGNASRASVDYCH